MSIEKDRVEEALADHWVLEFDKESEMEILTQLDDIIGDGDVFWDVGAHAGMYSIVCADLFPDVEIYCFEPSEFTRANVLEHNVGEFDNVTIVPHPLADATGTDTFVRSGNGHTTNSLLSTPITPDDPQETDIETYTARDVIDELSVEAPDAVKIDVEGAEYRVLQGFDDDLFDTISTFVLELHHIDADDTDTVPYLQDNGFETRVVTERETYDERRQEHVLARNASTEVC